MLYKTRGIALSYIKYRDTSIIAKIYTEAFGLQSYIQNGARSAKAKTKMSFFQPLTLVDMVVYHKPGQEIHRISEIKTAYVYQQLQTNQKKIAVSSFLCEVLSKCLKEEIKNVPLFEFLFRSFVVFDQIDNDNFHLIFLIKLSAYLGFYPHQASEILGQVYTSHALPTTHLALIEEKLNEIIDTDIESNIQLSNDIRSRCIDCIVDYYGLHVNNFGELKSLRVLREL